MPQKNTSIFFTLFTSVFMMMFVAGLFHLPNNQISKGLESNLFKGTEAKVGQKIPNSIDNENIYLRTKNSLPQE